jgi:hypothetical protein
MMPAVLGSIPWATILSSATVGAVIATSLNHFFAARRDAINDTRANDRDTEREQRERDSNEQRQLQEHVMQRNIVATDLLAHIRVHCTELRPWLLQANPQPEIWFGANQTLLTRANDRVVSEGLRDEYPALIDAIHYESKTIATLQRILNDALPKIFGPNGDRLPCADIEEHYLRAQSIESVADVIARYARLVEAYGDPDYAKELTTTATQFKKKSHDMLRRQPNSF